MRFAILYSAIVLGYLINPTGKVSGGVGFSIVTALVLFVFADVRDFLKNK